MKKPKKMKLLVPVDGSNRALNTIRYVGRVKPFRDMEIVLFHVFNSVPEGYWDLEKDPRSTSTVRQVRSWEIEQRKKIKLYMEQARQYLVKAGTPPESITVKVQNRKKGVARDIIAEARNGYAAVVTRRRGMTGLRRIVLGSVATKLLTNITFLPLILVGKRLPNKKILLAFDGSENAGRAVKFVGSMLGGLDYEVNLFTVIRSDGQTGVEYRHIFSPKEFGRVVGKEMALSLKVARTELVDSGFMPDKVSTQIVIGASSRAGVIAEKAKGENFGTIVMGRKGRSSVRDFFVGRVTNKVIYMARQHTVWVIR
ncbi:MAG: universal stress protein [Deltaproteobacteria bacterium]|jgi:nucleotide-binding universal stress UspA family protein|nr:universal stress protein [Deltaproteobacteria bacterium]MBW2481118.1 universal stress protein [Deltaproteobacteria bacterium]